MIGRTEFKCVFFFKEGLILSENGSSDISGDGNNAVSIEEVEGNSRDSIVL
jgi:hypothetical protein